MVRKLKDWFLIRWFSFKFFLGFMDNVVVYAQNIENRGVDLESKTVVHSIRELIEFARDYDGDKRYINGKRIEYLGTSSALGHDDSFFFIVFYRNAS